MRTFLMLLLVGWMSTSAALADDRGEPRAKSQGAGDGITALDSGPGRTGGPTARTASHRGGRDPRGHGHYRAPHYYPRYRIGVGWNYGWYGPWGPYASYWWDPWWYGPRWGSPRVYPVAGERYGALDLDLSPERVEVWIDGERVGVADQYDGFPEYLWLEEGTYDVAFYLPGFRTLARQYTIVPGLVIDVEDRLERGEAVHPNDLPAKTHERRDERLRREQERRAQLEAERAEAQGGAAPGDREWIDARAEPGSLRLSVEPEDASVYLDGRFLGSARELASLRAGLLVDPGTHRLEVVRPGYRGERLEVEVTAGESERLEVSLEAEGAEPVN